MLYDFTALVNMKRNTQWGLDEVHEDSLSVGQVILLLRPQNSMYMVYP